ncbi:hypothetical protein TPSD3_15965 [Thioflexithrix psekupsensis]|uniref:Outer membrane protein assembly factor BamC n=2 Tax=Thioflexithrix psekupsensis TaxID=1570016 RepID=A0A251X659_9GAMM|nr:hypothetical protein TPSD3_15965 [Thioflexithrix psekupsensis]
MLLLNGCGVFDRIDRMLPDNRANYKASEDIEPLELPPGFHSNQIREQMLIPRPSQTGVTTLSEYTVQPSVTPTPTAPAPAPRVLLPAGTGVEQKRAGQQRWLVINAPVEQVWESVRYFWREQGIAVLTRDETTGMMETEWRANPQHRGQDRYRVRLEAGETRQQSRLFLTHQAREPLNATAAPLSVANADELSGGLVSHEAVIPRENWQLLPSDSELEAAMLQRLLAFIGVDRPRAEALLTERAAEGVPVARLEQQAGEWVLLVNQDLENTWRRVGIALDRVGFTVEERDRNTATYVVRYADPDAPTPNAPEKKGFWQSIRGDGDSPNLLQTYQLGLSELHHGLTRVQVLTWEGQTVKTSASERILSLIQEQL